MPRRTDPSVRGGQPLSSAIRSARASRQRRHSGAGTWALLRGNPTRREPRYSWSKTSVGCPRHGEPPAGPRVARRGRPDYGGQRPPLVHRQPRGTAEAQPPSVVPATQERDSGPPWWARSRPRIIPDQQDRAAELLVGELRRRSAHPPGAGVIQPAAPFVSRLLTP
jgi:hypothetical protein